MKFIPTLLCSSVLFCGFSIANEASIKTAYEEFDKAMLAKNYAEAFGKISDSSQEMIKKARTLALSADRATLTKEPVAVILNVFQIRKNAGNKLPKDGAETIGIMSSNYERSSKMVGVGEITIEGDKASAVMLMSGKPSEMKFAFIKEDGDWKLDMASQLKMVEEMMLAPMKESGQTREATLDRMGKAATTKEYDPWQPLK